MAELVSIGLTLDSRQLEAAAQRAANGLRQVGQAATQTQQQLGHTGSASGQASRELGRLGDTSSRTAGAVRELGTSLAGLAASVVSLRAVGSALAGAVEASLRLEALRSAFTAIEGSAQAAANTLAFVRTEAERLGLSAITLADSFKSIDAAARGTALQGQGVRDIFVAVAETSRVLGLSADQTQGALLAIGQSISKGAIQAEELRGQLGERLPGAFQIMARALGVTTEALSKMLDDGVLKGQAMVDAWQRFAAQLHSEYGPAVAGAAAGVSAEFNRLGNATTDVAQRVGAGLLPAVGDAARAFTDLIKLSSDTAQTLGQSLDPVVRGTTVGILILANATLQAGKGIAAMATLATEGVRGFKIALEDMAATSAQVDAIIQRTLQGGPAATGQTPQGQAPRASAPGVATGTEQTAARAKQALTLFDELKTKLGQINTQAGVTPTLVNKTREAMKQLQDTAENVRKLFPGEAPAEVTAGLRDVERQYKALQDQEEAGRSARRAGTQASRQEAREERQAEREAEQLAAERRQQAHARGQLVLQQIDHLAELAAAQEREREELTLTEDAYEQLTLVRALEAAGISTQAGSYGELLLKRRDELQVLRESAKVREELKKYEEQQISTLERLTKTTDQLRYAETRRLFERAQIAEDDPRLVAAMERDIDISLRESLKAPLESFDKAKDATTDFSTFFADTILNATDIAKRGFAGFADSVIQSLQRIALQQFIRPALEQFIGAGLQSLSFLGGGTASAGEAASAVAGFASRFGDVALPRQHGGPVEAGQPYVVGERGRELFVPRQSGTIVPGAMASPTVIVNISTPDASSFLRSRGEVQQSMARAVQAAMRFA